MKKIWSVLVLFSFGCDGLAVAPGGRSPGVAAQSLAVTLQPLQSCSDVESSLRQMWLAYAASQVDAAEKQYLERAKHCADNTYYGYGHPGGYADAGMAADASAYDPNNPPSDNENSSGGPKQTSGTNNQVAAVDEPDLVKTVGSYLYIATGNNVRIIQSWPPSEAKTTATLSLNSKPKKLFVHENQLVIFAADAKTSGYGYSSHDYYGYSGGNSECTYGYDCEPRGDGHPTRIFIYDITQKSAPKLVREISATGSYLSARRIGSTVHLVLDNEIHETITSNIQTWTDLPSCGHNLSETTIKAAFSQLWQKNKARIEAAKMPSWRPRIIDTLYQNEVQQTSTDHLQSCGGFYRTSVVDGTSLTTVLSINLHQPAQTRSATILSRPGTVYVSEKNLYLAVRQQKTTYYGWYNDANNQDEITTIHGFAISDENKGPQYAASGLIAGHVLNQFSMDEYQGHLRVATTTGWATRGWDDSATHSTLTVLKQVGSSFVPEGVLDKLAPTEDIRAVRFAGEKAYVVTFKKTDPLFVIDLSDPKSPKTDSELKIPGFSTYMQMMDPNHLLTIGYDANDQGDFAWFAGVQLQIFDVTDAKNPKLTHKEIIGTRGTSSEALTNHLAFTYFAPKQILALPMTICEGGQQGSNGDIMTFSGLLVYDVTSTAGFKLRGKIWYPAASNCYNWWTDASSVVRRSIVMDDYIYSMSDSLLKINSLNDLNTDIKAIPLL